MDKKDNATQNGVSHLQKARQAVSRPLTDKDREVGRVFFLAASVEVLLDEASIYCNIADAPKVTKILDALKVSHGAPKEVARVKGTCIIGANVRLLIDIVWTVQAFMASCTIDIDKVDPDMADQLISMYRLKLGKTMTQSYRFFGSVMLYTFLAPEGWEGVEKIALEDDGTIDDLLIADPDADSFEESTGEISTTVEDTAGVLVEAIEDSVEIEESKEEEIVLATTD